LRSSWFPITVLLAFETCQIWSETTASASPGPATTAKEIVAGSDGIVPEAKLLAEITGAGEGAVL
jgi:hypothetical protein